MYLVPNETQEEDNLSEIRIRRLQQAEGEIARHIEAAKQAVAVLENSDAEIAKALYTIETDKLYLVDGYKNMTEYARVRWPDLSKVELSHMLAFGRINARVASWNEEQELTNSPNLLTLLKTPGQARAAAPIPEEDLIPTLLLATEAANGHSPPGRVIAQAHQALNGETPTNARIGRLDTEKNDKKDVQPVIEKQRHRRGWMENYSVDGQNFVFTACGHPFTLQPSGKIVKPKVFGALPLWKLQVCLEDAGLVVVAKTNVDALRKAYEEALNGDSETTGDSPDPEPRLSFDIPNEDLLAKRTLAGRSGSSGISGEKNSHFRGKPTSGTAEEIDDFDAPQVSFIEDVDLSLYDATPKQPEHLDNFFKDYAQ